MFLVFVVQILHLRVDNNLKLWFISSYLHVQLQDVCICLQQLTHVGFGATKVSVDKLLDVTVG